ncbi:hypothetical protein ACFHW2_12235 [Actinomadura sp. LOL_016]|uniref:hypothetical protein n=1 Tax=unclassified Actinomadura TaxID=2626254 RepID=UPI003A80C66F
MAKVDPQVHAREVRLAEDTTALIDYASRLLGAVETGNWYYANDKLRDLRHALDRLQNDLDQRRTPNVLPHVSGPRVWDRVAKPAEHYWLGRAINAWNERQKGGA